MFPADVTEHNRTRKENPHTTHLTDSMEYYTISATNRKRIRVIPTEWNIGIPSIYLELRICRSTLVIGRSLSSSGLLQGGVTEEMQ